ncbi:hypothetical protein BH11BAC2_BH11BAC2_15260 [soil metagenome]
MKTLLVTKTSMERKFIIAEIPAVYLFKIEVCQRSKIEKAITNQSKDYY